MRIRTFLHKLLSSVMHNKRVVTLILAVETVLRTKRLSLTELGRMLDLKIQERSGIRRIDRLLGNTKLHEEINDVSQAIINKVITEVKPVIIVDWSNIPNTTSHVLRAAYAAKGRAITLYEDVYPEKKLGNRHVQNKFLNTLKQLLPEGCKPIILSDGGFHNEWFRKIVSLGWDYVGRIRFGSGKKYRDLNSVDWEAITDFIPQATAKAYCIGKVDLCKQYPIQTNLVLYKGEAKGRIAKNKQGGKRGDSDSKDYSRAGQEPWILATSLTISAKKVVALYTKRMQIEEGFRDLKSSRYGFSFEKAYTKNEARIRVLLLIAMLASFIAWLFGYVGERLKMHFSFQANTIKDRRVLSFFYLGCQMIRRGLKIPDPLWNKAIRGSLC